MHIKDDEKEIKALAEKLVKELCVKDSLLSNVVDQLSQEMKDEMMRSFQEAFSKFKGELAQNAQKQKLEKLDKLIFKKGWKKLVLALGLLILSAFKKGDPVIRQKLEQLIKECLLESGVFD